MTSSSDGDSTGPPPLVTSSEGEALDPPLDDPEEGQQEFLRRVAAGQPPVVVAADLDWEERGPLHTPVNWPAFEATVLFIAEEARRMGAEAATLVRAGPIVSAEYARRVGEARERASGYTPAAEEAFEVGLAMGNWMRWRVEREAEGERAEEVGGGGGRRRRPHHDA